jgi:hypothetical protein
MCCVNGAAAHSQVFVSTLQDHAHFSATEGGFPGKIGNHIATPLSVKPVVFHAKTVDCALFNSVVSLSHTLDYVVKHMSYQNDPQSFLINLMLVIRHHMTVT